mmetsp:Transcript_27494/g.57755  ORF Transcript_27494/g.57755 Transcript_27494/m.57755 type:complete len:147 (-) Transcript_27494:88-528(-)
MLDEKNGLKEGYNKTYHNLFECCDCRDKWPDVFLSSLRVNSSFRSTDTRTQNPLLWINFEKIQSPEHVENCAIVREKVNIVEQFPKSDSSHHIDAKKISKSTLLGDGGVQFLASPILHNLAIGVEIGGKGIGVPFSFVGHVGCYVF